MKSRYSFVVDMDDADESDVVVHCKDYNRFDHLLFSKKKYFKARCFAERHSYTWHENKAWS